MPVGVFKFMNYPFRKKIAVIRALDIRLIQAEYASHFKKIRSEFISNYNKEVSDYLKSKKNTKYVALKLVPPFLLDPFSLLLKKPINKSWLFFEPEKLENTLKEADIFQIQEPYFFYSAQVANLARKLKKPMISAPWTSFLHPSTFIPPYCLNVRRAIDQTDLFIIRTTRVNEYLSHFKISDSKKVLIYHGSDLRRFHPASKKKEDKVKILFVGQLVEHKGIDDLLDVFPKLLKEARKDIELIICGSGGKLEQKVVKMSKTLPINYLGYVSNLEIPRVYRQADIFCGPSKDWHSFGIKRTEEGFGFVFIEAMASGLSVVTNDCGAIKEAVGEDNYLNKQGDKEALFRSLLELINDSNMRRDIGINNRKRVENYFDIKKQIIKEEKEIIKRFYSNS